MDFAWQPAFNALLNVASAALLARGWVLIRRGERERHRRVMLGAFAASALFLASYLIYHARVGTVRFQGSGTVRALYLSILATHSILAAVAAPLAIIALAFGLRGRLTRHRALARWTLPVWLYVSTTGVAVYLMLYHL